MARQNAQLLAFNRGEVSARALTRIDVDKLKLASECQLNWYPTVVGAMSLRPGLGFVGGVQSDLAGLLLPFVFAKTDTALLELTPNLLRVRVNDALITRAAVSTTVPNGNFSSGASWVTSDTTAGCTTSVGSNVATLAATARGGIARIRQEVTVGPPDQNVLHALRVVVERGPVVVRAGSTQGVQDFIPQATLETGTHSLAFTPTGASLFIQIETGERRQSRVTSVQIESAGTFSLPTPWGAADLDKIRIDQSGDIVWLDCDGYQPRRLVRRSATGFGIELDQTLGPFQSAPGLAMTMTPDVYEAANGTLAASRPYFKSTHVGALFRLFSPGQVNKAVLGAAGAFTEPIRVSGVGNDRKFGWTVAGTFVGTLTLQRSLVGPASGFTDVATRTAAGTTDQDDTATLNNVVAWYRVGFKRNEYTSGSATVHFGALAADGAGENGKTTGAAAEAGGRYGICRVSGVNSATSANIEVLEPFSSLNPTTDWVEGAWSDVNGWPTSLCFHEGRLWQFRGDGWWGSETDKFNSYRSIDGYGESLGDAGVVAGNFGSGPMDVTSWGVSALRLLLGREQSIGSGRSSSFDQPITPTAFGVKDCSTDGADRLPAVKVDQNVIYVQQSHRRVFELGFSGQRGDYVPRDLTRINLDVGKPKFVSVAAQRQPDPVVWFVRTDGQAAGLLYSPGEEVEAWFRIQTQGVIERVCVLPSDDIEDRVYFIVKRTIDGNTRRFIEKLALRENCIGGAQNLQLDSYVTYSGAAATTVTLAHLPNTLVTIWADGRKIGTATTDGSGVATLPDAVSAFNIVAGLAGEVVTATSAGDTISFSVPTKYNGCPAEVWSDVGGTGSTPIHIGTIVVSGGTVTLPSQQQALGARTFIACLGYVAPFQSAKLAYGAMGGVALTMKKKIDTVGLVLLDTSHNAVTFGQRFDKLDPLPEVIDGATVATTTVWPQFDRPSVTLPGEWTSDARLCLLAQAPNPATIAAAVIAVNASEK